MLIVHCIFHLQEMYLKAVLFRWLYSFPLQVEEVSKSLLAFVDVFCISEPRISTSVAIICKFLKLILLWFP